MKVLLIGRTGQVATAHLGKRLRFPQPREKDDFDASRAARTLMREKGLEQLEIAEIWAE